MRIKFIRIVITCFFCAVALGLFCTQLLQGNYFYELSINNRIRLVPLQGERGLIKDRNGVVLAGNRLAFNVTVIPQEVKDEDHLFKFLSSSLKADKEKLLKVYRQGTDRALCARRSGRRRGKRSGDEPRRK